MKKQNKVLVVAVHADDEVLGCGGTLLKHKAAGDQIFWLIITKINSKDVSRQSKIPEREKTIEVVAKEFAFDEVIKLDIPAMELDEFPMRELIQKISDVFNRIQPSTVYLPFKGDVHSDHRKSFEAAYSCTKTFRYPYIKKVLMMETISETEFAPSFAECAFLPNYFVDVTLYFDKKLKILEFYKTEMGEHPFPRSLENVKALATFRGAIAGCQFAESFMLIKGIDG